MLLWMDVLSPQYEFWEEQIGQHGLSKKTIFDKFVDLVLSNHMSYGPKFTCADSPGYWEMRISHSDADYIV